MHKSFYLFLLLLVSGFFFAEYSNVGLAQNTPAPIPQAIHVTPGAPANSLYMDGSGNVGVGTTSPAALLSVGSSSQFQVDTNGNTTLNHIIGSTTLVPTIAVKAAAGTGATIGVTGNDTDTTVVVTTGTSPTTGNLFTVTWASAFTTGQAPRCIAGPATANTASVAFIWPVATTTSVTFAIQTALEASTQYGWFIHCAS